MVEDVSWRRVKSSGFAAATTLAKGPGHPSNAQGNVFNLLTAEDEDSKVQTFNF